MRSRCTSGFSTSGSTRPVENPSTAVSAWYSQCGYVTSNHLRKLLKENCLGWKYGAGCAKCHKATDGSCQISGSPALTSLHARSYGPQMKPRYEECSSKPPKRMASIFLTDMHAPTFGHSSFHTNAESSWMLAKCSGYSASVLHS